MSGNDSDISTCRVSTQTTPTASLPAVFTVVGKVIGARNAVVVWIFHQVLLGFHVSFSVFDVVYAQVISVDFREARTFETLQ